MFSAEEVIELMRAHRPVAYEDRGCVYWYCSCGKFLDYLSGMVPHVEGVVKTLAAEKK